MELYTTDVMPVPGGPIREAWLVAAKHHDDEGAVSALKMRAGVEGADAVIGLRIAMSEETFLAYGTAIKR